MGKGLVWWGGEKRGKLGEGDTYLWGRRKRSPGQYENPYVVRSECREGGGGIASRGSGGGSGERSRGGGGVGVGGCFVVVHVLRHFQNLLVFKDLLRSRKGVGVGRGGAGRGSY